MHNKVVNVYVFSRNGKKKSNVYKIVVHEENEGVDLNDILKCNNNNFTLNPNVALFIAHSEAKKMNQNQFVMSYINGVADFSELKSDKNKTKENKK